MPLTLAIFVMSMKTYGKNLSFCTENAFNISSFKLKVLPIRLFSFASQFVSNTKKLQEFLIFKQNFPFVKNL